MSAPNCSRLLATIQTSRTSQLRVEVHEYDAGPRVGLRIWVAGKPPSPASSYFPTASGVSVLPRDLPALMEALTAADAVLKGDAFRPLVEDVYLNAADVEAKPSRLSPSRSESSTGSRSSP